jgi:hypothetical protein
MALHFVAQLQDRSGQAWRRRTHQPRQGIRQPLKHRYVGTCTEQTEKRRCDCSDQSRRPRHRKAASAAEKGGTDVTPVLVQKLDTSDIDPAELL